MDTKKINIAVIISSDSHSGGGYQYERKVIDILQKNHEDESINFNFYSFKKNVINDFLTEDIEIKFIKENIFNKIHRLFLSNLFIYNIFSKIKFTTSYIEKQLSKDNIDLVYFLAPNLISQGLSNIPYVFTLWDLGHLDTLEFPETAYNREFEIRENIYLNSLKKAYKVIVDLDYGKQNAINRYNLDEKRVEVLKFLPNIPSAENDISINIKDKYHLLNDYIFYPAQFWAHKNHVYILKSIKMLREKNNIDLDVVFSGSDKGNLDYVLRKAKDLNIEDLIHYIGFVSAEEMPALYKQSLALVMPTYLGPTNIPPLEAFAYKTPVCYSDKPSFREQVGDAAFFMDLKNPDSLVKHLITIQNNKILVNEKIEHGSKVLSDWDEKKFYKKLILIFKDYLHIRDLWD